MNGDILEEDYLREPMYNDGDELTYVVPADSYFMLGDNRNNSTDSRRIGFIDPSDVLGKAVLRLYPFDSFGKVS